jgi:hypothetical protein
MTTSGIAQADVQLAQLLLVDRLGAPVSRHCARCVFGNAITSRIALGAGHQRDDAVQAEGDAAVRRRAVLQRVEQEAELGCASSGEIFSARNTLLCTSSRWIRTEPPPISQPLSTMS